MLICLFQWLKKKCHTQLQQAFLCWVSTLFICLCGVSSGGGSGFPTTIKKHRGLTVTSGSDWPSIWPWNFIVQSNCIMKKLNILLRHRFQSIYYINSIQSIDWTFKASSYDQVMRSFHSICHCDRVANALNLLFAVSSVFFVLSLSLPPLAQMYERH